MDKLKSRRFLFVAFLVLSATVALFLDKAGFVEWASAAGGFVGVYIAATTTQKIKANGNGK